MRSKLLGSVLGIRGLCSSIDCAWLALDVSGCPGLECDAGRDRIYGTFEISESGCEWLWINDPITFIQFAVDHHSCQRCACVIAAIADPNHR